MSICHNGGRQVCSPGGACMKRGPFGFLTLIDGVCRSIRFSFLGIYRFSAIFSLSF